MRVVEMPLEHVDVVEQDKVHVIPVWLIRQIANGVYDPTPEQVRLIARIASEKVTDFDDGNFLPT